MADQWGTGDIYDRYMGRWSRPIATAFIDWLDVQPGATWLDVGCGTGALATTIHHRAAPSRVVGIDPSPGFIEHATRALGDSTDLRVGDAQALPFADASVDATVSGLALNFVPNPRLGASEMTRVTKPAGIVAAYVWDYADGMEMIRFFWDAAIALDSDAAGLDEAVRFPLCTREALGDLFGSAGVRDVKVTALETVTEFTDFDDFWDPILGGQGPAPTYVASLDDERREELAAALRERLTRSGDGPITLAARAWAVAGTA